MKQKKKTPFIIVMMPHLIMIEDGVVHHDGYLSYECPLALNTTQQ